MPRWLPYAILTVSALIFFGELVCHPTDVLYSDHSDVFAEHLPAKIFVVRAWKETGELPLWCPYLFSGEPIVADLQVAMFYPFHMLFLYLPQAWLAPGLSWLVVLHVMAAGWFMFAYARSQGLGQVGALVAALGYMLSPKWLLHLLVAGHYITLGMTWIPLTLLLLDIAMRKRCLLAATGAGCSFALLILCTHPQWILYGGVLIGLWSLGPMVESGQLSIANRKFPLGTLGYGVWAVLIATALSAVQLLPT